MPLFKTKRLTHSDKEALAELFSSFSEEDTKLFHPHNFDKNMADGICCSPSSNIYIGFYKDNTMIGYGFLRGWGEGYDIPSLGLIIHKDWRGNKLGKYLLYTLVDLSNILGGSVMLTVEPNNKVAIDMYEKCGFKLDGTLNGRLKYILKFDQPNYRSPNI